MLRFSGFAIGYSDSVLKLVNRLRQMTNILCIILSRDDVQTIENAQARVFSACGAGEAMEAKTIGIVGITAEGASLCYRTIVAESARALPDGAHPPIAMYTGSF